MNLEKIIKEQKNNPLFDSPYFTEIVKRNDYDASKKFYDTLDKLKNNNDFQKNIYTINVFLEYKDIFFSQIITQIKQENSSVEVIDLFDEEVLNWIDHEQMESEGIENEYDYYTDFGNGEAENVIYESLINDWMKTHNKNKKLSFHDHCRVYELLEETYEL